MVYIWIHDHHHQQQQQQLFIIDVHIQFDEIFVSWRKENTEEKKKKKKK